MIVPAVGMIVLGGIKFYVVDADNQDSRKGLKASTITMIKILEKEFAAARNKRSGDLSTTETTDAELNNDSSKENRRTLINKK
ncbi:unnamed protein product [Rotaria socialis]|nr:unnamed protein product [Rotaria socialis]